MDINCTILVGRLTKDMELRYTKSGTALGNISLATNRRVKQGNDWKDEASFFDAVLWGKQAEALSKYLTKGTSVCLKGELVQDRWEQDGQKRSRVKINVQSIQVFFSNDRKEEPKKQKQEFYGPEDFEDDIPF